MATRAEVISHIARRLREVRRQELAWADLTAAVGMASQTTKDQIVTAIQEGDGAEAGNLLMNIVFNKIAADADAEAQVMLADDSLSLTDLERIF